MRPIDADALVKKFAHPPELMYTNVVLDEIRSAPTVGGWISVEDRLPEECEDVLLYAEWETAGISDISKSSGIKIGYHIDGHWHIDNRCRVRAKYWMLLPEPPKEVDDDDDET